MRLTLILNPFLGSVHECNVSSFTEAQKESYKYFGSAYDIIENNDDYVAFYKIAQAEEEVDNFLNIPIVKFIPGFNTIYAAKKIYDYINVQEPGDYNIDIPGYTPGSPSYSPLGLRENRMRAGAPVPVCLGRFTRFPDLYGKKQSVNSANLEVIVIFMCVSSNSIAINNVSLIDTDSSTEIDLTALSNGSYFSIASGWSLGTGTIPIFEVFNQSKDDNLLKLNSNGSYEPIQVNTEGEYFEFSYAKQETDVIIAQFSSADYSDYVTLTIGNGAITTEKRNDDGTIKTARRPFRGEGETSGFAFGGAFPEVTQIIATQGDSNNASLYLSRQIKITYIENGPEKMYNTEASFMYLNFTSALGVNRSSSVRISATSELPNFNDPTDTRESRSIADAIMYIAELCDVERSNIDIDALTRLNTVWTARGDTFDGIFDTSINFLKAIKAVASRGRTKVVLYNNQKITFVRDQYRLVKSFLFDDSTVLKDSFNMNKAFDRQIENDGFTVRYRDEADWLEQRVQYPTDALNPKEITLFGCTSQTAALDEAKYQYYSKKYRTRTITFDVARIGSSVAFGDRIGLTLMNQEYDLIVQTISKRSNERYSLQCIDYDERIYEQTDDPAKTTEGIYS